LITVGYFFPDDCEKVPFRVSKKWKLVNKEGEKALFGGTNKNFFNELDRNGKILAIENTNNI
jgi:hypothetical protein